MVDVPLNLARRCAPGKNSMSRSKQPNEVSQAAYRGDPGHTAARKESQRLATRKKEYLEAKEHADSLGISERVSDGLRRVMLRYEKSPLVMFLDAMHESEEEIDAALEDAELSPDQRARARARLIDSMKERKLDAAKQLLPYLHNKADAPEREVQDPDHPRGTVVAPVLNLTVTHAAKPAELPKPKGKTK